MAHPAETAPVKFLDVTRPDFTTADAERLARDLYGIAAKAKEFYSERDRIFHLKAGDGREHVLKLVHPDEDEATLDFQIQALNWIAREGPTLALPRVIRNKSGGQLRSGCWISYPAYH
jgi:hydroxylysine kinase